MSGISFKFKWLSFLGKIPSTQAIEEKHQQLLADFKRFHDFEQSESFMSFKELEKRVTSDAFKKKLEAIKADTFEKTPEFKKWSEYQALLKNSAIKKYFKYLDTGIPSQIDAFEKSDTFKRYQELQKITSSASFQSKLKELKASGQLAGSETDKQHQEWQSLQNNADLKFYLKTSKSSKFNRYTQTLKSSELKKLQALEEYIQSEEFKQVKAEKEDKDRYKQSEEYLALQEYEQFKAGADYQWYEATKKKNDFKELDKWELTFSDEFADANLNTEKWITHYYWGKALLNEGYALASDKHFLTAGKNLQIKNSVLSILTKKEAAEGKAWDAKIGFYPREFAYTSGIISTGDSFRQAYGRFEAKLKINSTEPVSNAFWLASEKIIPQIDIVKTDDQGKLVFANHWGPQMQSSIAKLSKPKFKSDWYIFGINWTPNSIQWTINGVTVREETTGVPKEKMYLVLNSGLYVDGNDTKLPAAFEIDWVRVYQPKA